MKVWLMMTSLKVMTRWIEMSRLASFVKLIVRFEARFVVFVELGEI